MTLTLSSHPLKVHRAIQNRSSFTYSTSRASDLSVKRNWASSPRRVDQLEEAALASSNANSVC